jgi:hypothetical protein
MPLHTALRHGAQWRDGMLGGLTGFSHALDPQGLRPRDPNGGIMAGTEQRQKRVALSVRVSDRDRDAIAAKAASSGLPIAEYVRRCALGRQTPSRVDARLINELRRLGGLQKHLYNGDRDRGPQYAEILLELTDAIRRVGQPVDAV